MAQRGSDLKVSIQICILMLNFHCVTLAVLTEKFLVQLSKYLPRLLFSNQKLIYLSLFFNDTCCSKIPQVYVRCSFKLDKIPSYPNICVKVQCSLIVKREISNFFSEPNLFYFKMWSSVKQLHYPVFDTT